MEARRCSRRLRRLCRLCRWQRPAQHELNGLLHALQEPLHRRLRGLSRHGGIREERVDALVQKSGGFIQSAVVWERRGEPHLLLVGAHRTAEVAVGAVLRLRLTPRRRPHELQAWRRDEVKQLRLVGGRQVAAHRRLVLRLTRAAHRHHAQVLAQLLQRAAQPVVGELVQRLRHLQRVCE